MPIKASSIMYTRKEQIANGAEITPLTREEQALAGNAITPITEKERFYQKAYSGGGGTEPTGTIDITSNGTYDVTEYASAAVNVPGVSLGSVEVSNKTGYKVDIWAMNETGAVTKKTVNNNASTTIYLPMMSKQIIGSFDCGVQVIGWTGSLEATPSSGTAAAFRNGNYTVATSTMPYNLVWVKGPTNTTSLSVELSSNSTSEE